MKTVYKRLNSWKINNLANTVKDSGDAQSCYDSGEKKKLSPKIH